MKWKVLTFLLIGMLIGIVLGSFLFEEVNALIYDEVYYLKKIYSSLSIIESDISSINSKVSYIEYLVRSILNTI